MKDGHEISFFEEGEPVIDGEPGDLKVRPTRPRSVERQRQQQQQLLVRLVLDNMHPSP